MSAVLKNINLSKERQCDVVSLPCKLVSSEEVTVLKDLIKEENTGGEEVERATFRGFPLQGKSIQLPEDYVGVVVKGSTEGKFFTEEKTLRVAGGFQSFMYWNWDKAPGKSDAYISALDWIDFARAIHEDPEEESKDSE